MSRIQRQMILIDASKQETHNIKAGLSLLAKKLRSCEKIKHNKNSLTAEVLEDCQLLVLGNPQDRFSDDELQALRAYVDRGGSLAVFASEGGQSSSKSNLNELLKGYGIQIDCSSVVRAVYHKYHHPKHALIANGIIQPEIGQEKYTPLRVEALNLPHRPQDDVNELSTSLSFVYPNGTTLVVETPGITLLSSGSTSYPVNCPIAAAWEGNKVGTKPPGRLVVVGSVDVFADAWIEKEENNQLCEVIFRFLLHKSVSFDPSIGRADFEEKETVPCISALANMVKSCILEDEPLPQDHNSLLISNIFSLKMDHVIDAVELYQQLNVPYEPLALIEPHFECPCPPLKMATHKPQMMKPSPPALELFDLDECLLDASIRLERLVMKYDDEEELEVFVEEAGSIVIPEVCNDNKWRLNGYDLSKYLLHHMANEIFRFKMQPTAGQLK